MARLIRALRRLVTWDANGTCLGLVVRPNYIARLGIVGRHGACTRMQTYADACKRIQM